MLSDKTECRKCVKALTELENIDDDADQLGIAFVKINDPELADEYSLGALPALVYYRKRIPVVYDGTFLMKKFLSFEKYWINETNSVYRIFKRLLGQNSRQHMFE